MLSLIPWLVGLVHRIGEAMLSLIPWLVGLDSVSGFDDQYVGADGRDLRLRQVSVLLPAVVTSVEHSDTPDVDEKHRCSEHVTRAEAGELDAPVVPLLMEVDQLHFL